MDFFLPNRPDNCAFNAGYEQVIAVSDNTINLRPETESSESNTTKSKEYDSDVFLLSFIWLCQDQLQDTDNDYDDIFDFLIFTELVVFKIFKYDRINYGNIHLCFEYSSLLTWS